ncbi:unnamed protein product [Pedinophyceae sp. YPF-701]|nr:unnamed protein product [Pedinophyceae sp. YPF-701]
MASAKQTTLAIHRPGLVLQKAVEIAREQQRSAGREAYIFFLGNKQSGKSTIINLVNGKNTDAPTAALAIEYTFRRGGVATDIDRKDIAHIWELSGGDTLIEGFAATAMLKPKHLDTAAVVITVDLSKPAEVLPGLDRWLRLARRRVAKSFKALEEAGSKKAMQIENRAKHTFAKQAPVSRAAAGADAKQRGPHPDHEAVRLLGVPVIVVATKWDVFHESAATEDREVMAAGLRLACHLHGASLVYLGGAHTPAPDRAQAHAVRVLIDHAMFADMDKPLPARVPPSLDPSGPIVSPAGCDRIADIGAVGGREFAGDVDAAMQGVLELHAQRFGPPAAPEAGEADRREESATYAERDIDGLLKQKREELEAQRRERAAEEEQRRRKKLRDRQRAAERRAGAKAAPARSRSNRAVDPAAPPPPPPPPPGPQQDTTLYERPAAGGA